eukprot:4991462-Heterocapsa_arctica.AAC.1
MSDQDDPEPSGMCADLWKRRLIAWQSRTKRRRPFFFDTQKGEMIPLAVPAKSIRPALRRSSMKPS